MEIVMCGVFPTSLNELEWLDIEFSFSILVVVAALWVRTEDLHEIDG